MDMVDGWTKGDKMEKYRWDQKAINAWKELHKSTIDEKKAKEELESILRKLRKENDETLFDKAWEACIRILLGEDGELYEWGQVFPNQTKDDIGLPICSALVQGGLAQGSINSWEEHNEYVKNNCILNEPLNPSYNDCEKCLPLSKDITTIEEKKNKGDYWFVDSYRPFIINLAAYYKDVKLQLAINERKKDEELLNVKIPSKKENTFLEFKIEIEKEEPIRKERKEESKENIGKEQTRKENGKRLLMGIENNNGKIRINSFNARIQMIFILNINTIKKWFKDNIKVPFALEDFRYTWAYFEQAELCPQSKKLYYTELHKMLEDSEIIDRKLQPEEKYYFEYLFGTDLTVLAFFLYICNISKCESSDERKVSGYFKRLFLVLKKQKSIYLRIRNLYRVVLLLGSKMKTINGKYLQSLPALLDGEVELEVSKMATQLEYEIEFQDNCCNRLACVMEFLIKGCYSGERALERLKEEDFDIWKGKCKKAIEFAEAIGKGRVDSEEQKLYCALQYLAINLYKDEIMI